MNAFTTEATAPDPAMQHSTLLWTEFPDVHANTLSAKSGTWADFIERIRTVGNFTTKEACPLVKLARFGTKRSPGGSIRHDDNLIEHYGIEGDYDAKVRPDGTLMTLGEAQSALQTHGIRAIVKPSASWTAEIPRLHVICPLSKPHLPADHERLVKRLNGALGGLLSAESFVKSQTYYFGALPTNDYKVLVTFEDPDEGSNIDELHELDSIAIGKPKQGTKNATGATAGPSTGAMQGATEYADPQTVQDLRSALGFLKPDSDDRKTWIDVAHYLRKLGNTGFELWDTWSQASDKYDPLDQRHRWHTIYPDTVSVGYKAVFARAQAAGWVNTRVKVDPSTGEINQHLGGFGYTQEPVFSNPSDEDDEIPYGSELQLSEEFANRVNGFIRWTPGLEWMVNNGTHWEKDDRLNRFNEAKAICRGAASKMDSPKIAAKICSAGTHNAILNLSRSSRGIVTSVMDWDKHPMLLNTPGDVVDLETGKQVSREGLLFTQVSGVHPSSMATPIWDRFISEVFDYDLEMVEFMQRMGGYSLTGSIKEQKLFFLHGNGANGKSVFLDVLRAIGGKYSYNLPSEALMTSKHESHPTMLASLHGKRLAISSEIEESAHWAEARIKSMTGDETLTARYMRQDFFTFRVSHKHVIAGNFKPRLKGDDFAMARRMILIPFAQRFEGARRDNNLPEKLKAEYPGILAWFIEGARKWSESGLAIPGAITEASREYMAEQDDIGLWVASCCEQVKGARELATNLFASFEAWKRSNGEHAGSAKTFSQRLERTYDKKRVTRGMEFIGLRLINDFRDASIANAYAAASRGD